MKKTYAINKSILLTLIIIASSYTLKAQLGSNISYRAIDSINYEVELTVYRDCGGSPSASVATIEVFGKSSGAFKVSLSKSSTVDITGINPQCTVKSSCSGGSYSYGVQEVIYKGTVNISGGACEYTFRYTNCCRPSGISTGPGNSTLFNESMVNKCYGLNTSTKIVSPRIVIGVGQDFRGKVFIGDTANRNDSVVYSLAAAQTGPGVNATYNGGYDYTKPITFLGIPNNGAPLPAGFHFNGETSELAFRPTKTNEVALLCFDAIEYRRVNGVMQRVGKSRMEYTVVVANIASNKVPKILGESVVSCVNKPLSIDVDVSDFDKSDSTSLEIMGLPQGATVVYTKKGKNASATISWTPQSSDISTIPYILTAIAKDNACPLSGFASKAIAITVREEPAANDIKIASKTVKCSSAEIVLDIDSKIKSPKISWIDEDSISFYEGDTATLYFKGSGWKKFRAEVQSSNFCDFIIEDSVLITPQYSLQLNTKNDSTVCANSNINFFSYPLNGAAPYTHVWRDRFNMNNTNDTVLFTVKADTNNYYKTVLVIDNDGCIGTDSVNISVYRPTYIEIANKKVEVCPNAPFQLSASRISGPQVKQFNWIGIDTFATVSWQTPSSTRYFLAVTNIHNCIVLDHADVETFDIGVNGGVYSPVCKNSTVQLVANGTAGVLPFTYQWLNTGASGSTATVTPSKDSSYVVRITDARGCEAFDTAKVTVFADTKYQLSNPPTICAGIPTKIDIKDLVGAAPYTFVWNGIASSDSSELYALQQTKNISIEIIDSNNCKLVDNITITVNQNPDLRLGSDKNVCQGTVEKLKAFVVGGKKPLSYLWSTGSQADSIGVTVNTPQEVILLVTDDNGCIDRDTINFDTLPVQKVILTPLANPLCDGAPPVSLQSIPNNGIWTGTGVNGKIFNTKSAGAGVHKLTFSFTSIYNCPEKDEIYAVVKQTPQPDFIVDKTQGILTTQFNFTNQTVADTTYTNEWNMGDGSPFLTSLNPSHTYNKVGQFTITLKVDNGVCPPQTIQKTNIIRVDSVFTSITKLEKEKIKVYPNPVSETLFLNSEVGIEKIALLDVLGKKIIEQEIKALNTAINVSELTNGVYTLSILLENGTTKTTKLIIQ